MQIIARLSLHENNQAKTLTVIAKLMDAATHIPSINTQVQS